MLKTVFFTELNSKLLLLYGELVGEHSQDKEDLLQEQGMQEAYIAQGHPVQEG